MTSRTYLVELTPAGNYFFGSEQTFNATDKADGAAIANYISRSREYPQQTAMLGLMRYTVLLAQNALDKSPGEKAKLIGQNGFDGRGDSEADWGKILRLSPLMIMRKKDCYVVAGQDIQPKPAYLRQPTVPYSVARFGLGKGGAQPVLEHYEEKEHKGRLMWRNVHDDKDMLHPDEIFIESPQIGIKKSFWGGEADKALYKQYFYRLTKGLSFGCYLTVTDDLTFPGSLVIVPFGADQGIFSIRFVEEEDNIFAAKEVPAERCKIVLASDAYCSDKMLDNCEAAITMGTDFRHIKTSVETKRYYNMGRKDGDMEKSGKMNLLERGSVLYTNNASAIIDELNSHQQYRKAGFNHYFIQPLN